jgi:hypothetical protein
VIATENTAQCSTEQYRNSQGDSTITRNTRIAILLTLRSVQCSAVQCSVAQYGESGKTTNTINTKHDIIMNERKTPWDVTEKN